MSALDDFTALLQSLQTVFAAENRPGGDQAALALGDVLSKPFDLPTSHTLDIVDTASEALHINDHPAAATTLQALRLIDWHYSGLEDGRIKPEIALSMATSELVGPNGMIFHPKVRVGLFIQIANLDYITRTHPAEETFVMLAGTGYWTCNGSKPQRQEVGAYIHHPSNAPHTSVTKDAPLIAAWRWTGDIAFEGYVLVD